MGTFLRAGITRSRSLSLAGLVTVLLVTAVACGSDRPAEQPTATTIATSTPVPAPTPVPTSAPRPGPTKTPEATATPSGSGFEFEEPEFPSPREFYILSNVDGGPLLLPYLDAAARQTEFSMTSTFHRSGSFDGDEFATTQRSLAQTNGRLFFTEILEVTYTDNPDDLSQIVGDPLQSEGTQVVSDGIVVYARPGASEKWIDVTSKLLEDGSFEEALNSPDQHPLGTALFSIASSTLFATFGIADEESIAEAEANSPVPLRLDFKQESADDETIVIANRVSFSDEQEFGGQATINGFTHDVVFTIDAELGLIVHAISEQNTKTDGPFGISEEVFLFEHEIDYSPQQIEFPQPGDPSIETDPDKIAAFLELIE